MQIEVDPTTEPDNKPLELESGDLFEVLVPDDPVYIEMPRDGDGVQAPLHMVKTAKGGDQIDTGPIRGFITAKDVGFADRRYYDALWSNNPAGMALVAPDGTMVHVNEAFARNVGFAVSELEGAKFQTITHPDDVKGDVGMVRKLLDKETDTYTMVKGYINKQEKTVWARLTVNAVCSLNGEVEYLIGIVHLLPNGGHYVTSAGPDDEVLVRPSLRISEFVRDNWKFFAGLGVTVVYGVFKVVDLFNRLLENAGLEW